MLKLYEECNGCSFYVLASLIKNLLVEAIVESYYLKFSLPMFLKYFLIFPYFQPNISYLEKTCNHLSNCMPSEMYLDVFSINLTSYG